MKMEIKVTSRETVKPSKPTPEDRRTFNLSAFDLLHRNIYFPLIQFYPQIQNPNSVSSQLKKSLSETLAIFYPLAGRRNDAVSLSCNDEGAIYLEATVNASISEILTPPKLESLNRLLPCQPYKLLSRPPQEGGIEEGGEAVSSASLPNLLVQVSRFKCGGISIGVCNLHALMDACSSSVVLKAWSAICREERDEMTWPDFESAFAVFPPRDMTGMRAGFLSASTKIEAMCDIRRFVFTHKAITTLRSQAKDPNDDSASSPTRYQVLSSFITKHMILSHAPTAAVVVLHIVDVRRRMGHPLSPSSMGNLLWPALVTYDAARTTPTAIDLKDIVRTTRQSMKKINRDLFLRMQSDPEFLRSDECAELLLEGIETKKEKVVLFVMTNWGNLGFEELDFGFGRPVWVGFRGGTQDCVPNSVVMIETKEGMEAWVSMEGEYMAVLEKDAEFRRFALLNPSVSFNA